MNGSLRVLAVDDLDIEITRHFAASREAVFEAVTRADLLRRWLTGPPGWSMVACESDLRVGGAYRHEWRGPDGEQLAMRGVYREVDPPRRVSRTESFEFGCENQAGEQLATLTLESVGDGSVTALRIVVHYPSREARDGALASGMEQGLAGAYDNLDRELVEVPQP